MSELFRISDWVGTSRLSRWKTDWVGIYRLSRWILTESGFLHSRKKNCFTMQRKYLEAKKRRSRRSTTKASLDLACSTLALTSFLVHFLQRIFAGCRALLFPPARLILRFRMKKGRFKKKDFKILIPDSVGTFWIIQTERTLFSCLNYSEIPDWVGILNNSDILPQFCRSLFFLVRRLVCKADSKTISSRRIKSKKDWELHNQLQM